MKKRRRKSRTLSLNDSRVADALSTISDEVLASFSFPVYSAGRTTSREKDADGFPMVTEDSLANLHDLQKQCWLKAESNPQINSHIRDKMGHMTGWGFGFSSERWKIDALIEEIVEDPRNNIYQNMPKFVARDEIEGELFLMFTLHPDGFVETDFIPPSSVGGGGDSNSGIFFHPTKQTFPLYYQIQLKDNKGSKETVLVPSINLAYYPDLESLAQGLKGFDKKKAAKSKYPKPNMEPYKQYNGNMRFIVHWNKGYMTKRNVSHIKTTIEWVNYYETLKKYEIDHKKSSGAYLWIIEIEDVQSFRRWIGMSEEERKSTGIMQTKDPGGTIVLPPGMKITCQNPKLNSITDEDKDIMQMVSSGLQKPQDLLLGNYNSTYASVKASQGPQGDRINDDLHYFRLFLIYDFWRPIFFLVASAREGFINHRYVKGVRRYKGGKPIFGRKKVPAYKFVDVCLPVSRLEDVESIARAYLGSKHASVVDTLGISRKEVAKKMGFPNYIHLRKEKTMEDEELPETLSTLDQEAAQEKAEAEPKKKEKDKTDSNKEDDKK